MATKITCDLCDRYIADSVRTQEAIRASLFATHVVYLAVKKDMPSDICPSCRHKIRKAVKDIMEDITLGSK